MIFRKRTPQPELRLSADQRTVRRHNLSLVLTNIAKGGRRSRAKVSAETGLNPSTVSSLIADLIDWGLLYEVGVEQDGSVGRPGRSLELNPDGGAAVGIEISDDGVGVLALDLSGRVRYRAFISQENRDRAPEDVVRQAAALATEALGSFHKGKLERMCTMALPGLVGSGRELLQAPNINWSRVPILDLWSEAMAGVSIVLENEARLAAYAEMTSGVAEDLSTFAYVSGGVGIGSGLVMDRTVFRGAHGFAGEFGHTVIERFGATSTWGSRGSVQTLAGERAIAKAAKLSLEDRAARGDPDWIGRKIATRAAEGDQTALDAIEQVGRALGVGIANLTNMFDMEAVILGGYFTHLSQWLQRPIEAELEAHVLAQQWAPLRILFSDMGREAAVRGAAAWSLDAILDRAGQEEAALV